VRYVAIDGLYGTATYYPPLKFLDWMLVSACVVKAVGAIARHNSSPNGTPFAGAFL
jgi:hypothetical protein